MCAESVDQEDGVTLDDIQVDTSVTPDATAVKGRLIQPVDRDWPYRATTKSPKAQSRSWSALVPYHRWARRGPSTMRIWLPTATL